MQKQICRTKEILRIPIPTYESKKTSYKNEVNIFYINFQIYQE